MKRFSLLQMGALTGLLATLGSPLARADDYDKKTVVTINSATEVPGIVLAPGTYVIKLLNSSSNRHIAEIMNERMDHLYALTFTAAAERVNPADKTILTFYEGKNGRPPAVRRWFWPGDTIGQEFLYPKDQAQKIAAATGEKVPEANLPTVAESGQSLTPDNSNGLNVQVSQNTTNDNTSANNTSANVTAAGAVSEPPLVAQDNSRTNGDTNSRTNQDTNSRTTVDQPARNAPATESVDSSREVAANTSSQAALPQTASQVPLIVTIGMISLAGALLLGLRKRASLD